MSHSQEAPRIKVTVMMDPSLRQRIEAERRKIESHSGFRVPVTQVIERILRRSLEAGGTEQDSVAPA